MCGEGATQGPAPACAPARGGKRLAVACDSATQTGGAPAGAGANRAFHQALAALAGNSQIDSLLTVIWDQIAIATRAGLATAPRIDSVHHEHEEILAALRAGGPCRAHAAVEVHIGQTDQANHDTPNETKEHT